MKRSLTKSIVLEVVCVLVIVGFVRDHAEAATVFLKPGDNIQAKVNANPAGTTFKFNAGSYNKQSIVPKSGNIFDGQGVATLNGKNFTKKAFQGAANNVTIKNLTIKKYKSDFQHAAVDGEFGNAWIITNNKIKLNRHLGVNWGNNAKVIGNFVNRNGELGVRELGVRRTGGQCA